MSTDLKDETGDVMPRDLERTKRYIYWNMIGVFAVSYDLSIREVLDMFKTANIKDDIGRVYRYLTHGSYSQSVFAIGNFLTRKGVELPELKRDPMEALFGREGVRIV